MLKLLCLLAVVAAAAAFRTKRIYTCGGADYYSQNNGEIASHSGSANGHNYGKNLNCVWRIEAPTGKHVELVAREFDIEEDTTCSVDWLELFDGKSTNSQSLGKFCGSVFNPITSSQPFLTLQFITDDSVGKKGFKMFYNFTDQDIHTCSQGQFQCANSRCIEATSRCDNQDDCGDDTDELNCPSTVPSTNTCAGDEWRCNEGSCVPNDWLCDGDDDCPDNSDELNCKNSTFTAQCGTTNFTGSSGTITSPNYPVSYPSNTHCMYHIQAPSATKNIAFKFDSDFHIEDDQNCAFDSVNITAIGTNGKRLSYGPFCGDTSPVQFTIPSNSANVMFESDDSDEYVGFRLDWKAIQ